MQRDVELQAGMTHWVPAQQHYGENIGDTDTHTIFVELKEGAGNRATGDVIGPSAD